MPFKLNAYLPSLQAEVQIKELYYKQYRELVKSLYNTDKKETIQQYNSILQDLCSDILDKDITFEDKLSLLLTVRNYCVSPDLNLKCTLPGNNTFTYTTTVETLLQLIKAINKSSTLEWNGISVSFSSYKARDEHVFLSNNNDIFVVLASYIDSIKINNETVIFKDFTLENRLQIVYSLPHALCNQVYQNILTIEEKYEEEDLLVIVNPANKEPVLRMSKNITCQSMQKLIEYNFTENLNNIYRAFYNMVRYAGFSPEYIDTITPVEMQVYWMYYAQDNEKTSENKNDTGGLNLPASGSLNSELGF